MATPRKHWFRVEDSIGRDDLSNDELATLVRLMAALNTQWARDGRKGEDACRIMLRPVDLQALTGCLSRVRSKRTLSALAAKVSLTITEHGDNTQVEWPKWLKTQNLDSPTRGSSRGTSAPESPPPQDAPARRKTQDAEERERAADAAPRARRRSRGTPCPDELDTGQRDRIRTWCAGEGIDPATLDAEWSSMRDHWRGKGELRADWEATFRTWLRRSRDFARRDQGCSRESPAQAKQRRIRDAAREAMRLSEPDTDLTPRLRAVSSGGES